MNAFKNKHECVDKCDKCLQAAAHFCGSALQVHFDMFIIVIAIVSTILYLVVGAVEVLKVKAEKQYKTEHKKTKITKKKQTIETNSITTIY